GSARSSLPGGTGAGSAQRLRELLGQTVDVGLRVHLRHAEKRALAELRILLREVEPAEDAALAQRAIDLGDGAPALVEVGDELLEERRRERRRAHAGQLAQASCRVAGARGDPAAELCESLRADEGEVRARRDRPQVLGRAGVLPRIA